MAPVAEIHGLTRGVDGPDRQRRSGRSRHMQAFAAIVTRCGDQQDTGLGAPDHRIGQPLISDPGIGVLAPGEIDDVGAFFNG